MKVETTDNLKRDDIDQYYWYELFSPLKDNLTVF